jgi:predicted amidohydrolase
MELTSILPTNLQSSLQGQVIELSNLQDKFIDVWTTAAQQNKVTIVAPSLPVIINGRPVNRAMVFSEKGYVGYQDKFFMTRFENEEWGISSGEKVLSIFEAEWGKFGIQICYDVEFPIGSQLLAFEGAQLIVAPSCTETIRGATRVHIGARARALENQIYTAVSQTVGNALVASSRHQLWICGFLCYS